MNWIERLVKARKGKPLPKNPGPAAAYSAPKKNRFVMDDPLMVRDLNDQELREKHAPLMDAWEQYQVMLKLYDSNNMKEAEDTKHRGMTMTGCVSIPGLPHGINATKTGGAGAVVKKRRSRRRRGGTHETI